MQRTQIYLPEDLRREIDRYRHTRGESMAEYTRKALEERLKKEKREKVDLKKLADSFIGSSKKTDKEIQEWLDSIREDRRSSDERLEKQWAKVPKKNK